jgi:hypothetical protein
MTKEGETKTENKNQFTTDMEVVLAATPNEKGEGVLCSPLYLIGSNNRFAAFAVNDSKSAIGVHFILTDAARRTKKDRPSIVFHSADRVEFMMNTALFEAIVLSAENEAATKKEN